jgi:hypothetical protein
VTEEPLPPKAPEMRRLLEPLVRHGVDFVLIGGVAGNALGSSYPTYDLDVVYARNRPNIDRLVAALREIGVRLRGAPADLPFQLDARTIENGANFAFDTPYGDFDALGEVAGIRSYEELRANSKTREVWGFTVQIASIDHLIAMKRAANRPKDKLMLEEYVVIADRQQRKEEIEREG